MLTSSTLESRLSIQRPSPLQPFTPDWPGAQHLRLFIKRDDRLHSIISGNKWRKLSEQLVQCSSLPAHILSFGGGYSNHLHALGYLCGQLGILFTAIVRGDYSQNLTPMLHDLQRWQSKVCYVSRIEYQQRNHPDYLHQLGQRYPDSIIIPEGGSNQTALHGVGQIIKELRTQTENIDAIIAPVASGATLAGLAQYCALQPSFERTQVIGIAVLKGVDYLESLVSNLLTHTLENWHIEHQYCGRGYAKADAEVLELCTQMHHQYDIPIEPVYSGKLFLAMKKKIAAGDFAPGSKLVLLHTGGLQGNRN